MSNLSQLKFKDYVWPHNPSLYNIKYVKDVIQHRYPAINGAELEDLGMDARVFSGSGAFFGPNANLDFSRLATVFYDLGPGKLVHPIWMPTDAIFSKLEVKQESTPNYIEYEFEFIEYRKIDIIEEVGSDAYSGASGSSDGSESSNDSASDLNNYNSTTHVVKQGETLSYLGSVYGVDWHDIADANKQLIDDPNMIQIGWELTIPS
jgi:hypothetical protein